MLIIRRGRGESIFIGDDIEVEILDIGSNQVKIGIRAPKQIPVMRGEILETIQANRAASEKVTASAVAGLMAQLRR